MKKTKESPHDIIGKYPRSNWVGLREAVRNIWKGGFRNKDGQYNDRLRYAQWVWKALWNKWLTGPIRCKFGTHRIGPHSDTGISMNCQEGGTMDVWCGDCDAALTVPIDDMIDKDNAKTVLDLAQAARKGNFPEVDEND